MWGLVGGFLRAHTLTHEEATPPAGRGCVVTVRTGPPTPTHYTLSHHTLSQHLHANPMQKWHRCIIRKGGLDEYILHTPDKQMQSTKGAQLRQRLLDRLAEAEQQGLGFAAQGVVQDGGANTTAGGGS